ncbi:hypothetical protein PJ985_08890 [Streptomyces sp. ACA25]|uniref:hypothetical protein n=1 Tax=Streptomyces sp. ACA25 TaxID=3022596 RepID=UPI002307DB40|nr:hypothetical protein [Streptomyces sp. ACA25]MDB1087682.1 hypothetical protein [Streptomyces sp. ACA25]
MNAMFKLGTFGAGVALAFAAAFAAGNTVDPVHTDPAPGHGDHSGSGPAAPGPATAASGAAPGGLQVSERGYTLVPPAGPLPSGEETAFEFRITGPDGAPVTAYTASHEEDLHLIVVRRDLSGYQHVHPTLGDDGTWSVPLTFEEAGDYRVFADFIPEGDQGGPLTLGADVSASGDYRPTPLAAPDRTATVDGYTVTLDGDLRAGAPSLLTLSVSKDGEPVTDLEPYLDAYGHLVTLRQGDLAYVHVHPEGTPGDGGTEPGPGIGFHTEAPSAGTYRLYLDFQHEGEVRTAEFTVEAEGAATADLTASDASDAHEDDGHSH